MHRTRKTTRMILLYALTALFILFSLFPIFWMISSSVKVRSEIYTVPPHWIPEQFTLDNYRYVLFETSIAKYFLNSLIIAGLTTLVSMGISIVAAYGLARFRFRGKNALALFILFSQMLPAAVVLVPLYRVYSHIGFLDSYGGLVIAYLIFTLPLTTWMLRGFFAGIPMELEEAAKIDGCSNLGILIRIIVPVAAPAMVSTATYAFIVAWQEFLFALTLTVGERVRTLPIGISGFVGQFDINWGAIMASSTVVSVPVILLFMSFYKKFVRGFTEGMW